MASNGFNAISTAGIPQGDESTTLSVIFRSSSRSRIKRLENVTCYSTRAAAQYYRLWLNITGLYGYVLRHGILQPSSSTIVSRVFASIIMAIEEQFILLSLGLVTIAVRVALRWQQVGPSGWQLDDYLMPLTGVSFPYAHPSHQDRSVALSFASS